MNNTNQEDNNRLLDMIIIGGGINGAGIAADAAGRGLSVGLFEAQDFASATSSASSKLIHGGLRYLEHYEFRLVSEALAEREVLLRKAPHISIPMRFRLPHRSYLRPAWMIRCGLFLYDHLGKRTTLPASHKVNLSKSGLLKKEMTIGFEYSDCWVDDARMVLLNIQSAQDNGAEVANYCKVEKAEHHQGIWTVTIYNEITNTRFERRAKALVNAAGPWVKQFFIDGLNLKSPRNIRLIKGSHIVVPKIHNENYAYILQNKDNRIVFVIPYLGDFSIIGTTDVEYNGNPREVNISPSEVDYLIDIVNQHFVKQLHPEDIIWSYSGVRPLCDDESNSPQAVTRDYTLMLTEESNAPLLSIFGGKLTTYRKLGEAAMHKLEPFFPQMGKPWTAHNPLPGGNFSCTREELANSMQKHYPWLTTKQAFRYVTLYGTHIHKMLAGVNDIENMGIHFANDIYQIEIDYMIDHEFVKKGEDLLWRRSKLGLYLTEEEQAEITRYIESRHPGEHVINLSVVNR